MRYTHFLTLTALFFSSLTHAIVDDLWLAWDLQYYGGFGYKHMNMTGKTAWREIMPSSYTGGKVFAGMRIHPNFGIEANIYNMGVEHRDTLLTTGTKIGNLTLASSATARMSNRLYGAYVDVNFIWPLTRQFEVLASVGYGYSKVEVATTASSGDHLTESALLTTTGDKARPLVRAGIGAEWMLTKMFGFRGMVRLENTSELRIKGGYQRYVGEETVKAFKDSTSTDIALMVRF